MKINYKFPLGQIVYHKTDPDQTPMLITAFIVEINGTILYRCSVGAEVSIFHAEELSKEKVFNVAMN